MVSMQFFESERIRVANLPIELADNKTQSVSSNSGKTPKLSELVGFKEYVENRMNITISSKLNGTKQEQAEALVYCAKQSYWVLMSFLKVRLT